MSTDRDFDCCANGRPHTRTLRVGDTVTGSDYERLPVGAKADGGDDPIEKVADNAWRIHTGAIYTSNHFHNERTITHLPDATQPEAYCVKDGQDGDWWVSEATPEFGYGIVYADGKHPTKDHHLDDIVANFGIDATQPEDATDAYVEPEPLKPVFNDDDVQRLKVTNGSTVLFDGLAVFEEADNGNVTVTPVPRCTSLFNRAGTSEIVRCGQHEGHSHGHWTMGSTPATSWGDSMEYGRVVESGGAS